MLTAHSLVWTPPWVVLSPEFALVISVPSISTGPRAYFAEPSFAQATSPTLGSSPPPPTRFDGLVQSSASYSACRAGVTHERSLGSVPAAGGVLLSVGATVGPEPGVEDAVGVGAAVIRTGRKRICADSRTRFSVASLGLPGRATTMLFPPWLVICASATPDESTRCRMMSIAWVIVELVTFDASVVVGVRMICVPPSRSRASFGVAVAVDHCTPATMAANRATIRTPRVTNVRIGREPRELAANRSSSLVRAAPDHGNCGVQTAPDARRRARASLLVSGIFRVGLGRRGAVVQRGQVVGDLDVRIEILVLVVLVVVVLHRRLDDLGDRRAQPPAAAAGRRLDRDLVAVDVDHLAEHPGSRHDLLAHTEVRAERLLGLLLLPLVARQQEHRSDAQDKDQKQAGVVPHGVALRISCDVGRSLGGGPCVP